MVAVIFGRIILRRNRQIISPLSMPVLEARPEHRREGTASGVLSSKVMVFLRQAFESRENFPWTVQGNAPGPSGTCPHFTQVLQTPLILLSQHPVPVPFGHVIPQGRLGVIGTLWEGSWRPAWPCRRCSAVFIFVDI